MLNISILMLLLLLPSSLLAADPVQSSIKMVRSLSGPSGKMIGNKYVLDEVRNRFVYPNENSLVAYFEWQAPVGDYTLSAYWKDPQGKVVAISPDIKMQTVDANLSAYWTFIIDSGKEGGIWTVEIRINGEPAGSHSFELVMPPKTAVAASASPAEPTLDEIYRSAIKSLVWVNKLDSTGHRIGRSSGFVVAANSILTTFQAIDLASKLEIEFADGKTHSIDVILACSRLQDWALLKADIEGVPPMPLGKSESATIGKEMISFAVGAGGARTIGAVIISGKNAMPGGGEKIHLNVPLPPSAFGEPLLDVWGKVVGVIGLGQLSSSVVTMGGEDLGIGSNASVTPIEAIPFQANNQPATLQQLRDARIISSPLSKPPVFIYGTVADTAMGPFASKSEFSKKDKVVIVTSWTRKDKITKGLIALNIYDSKNRIRNQVKPQILKLPSAGLIRNTITFNPASLESGPYLLEILWDDVPAWRTYIRIVD